MLRKKGERIVNKSSLTTIACALLLCAGTAQAMSIAQLACERQMLDAKGTLEQQLKNNRAFYSGRRAK